MRSSTRGGLVEATKRIKKNFSEMIYGVITPNLKVIQNLTVNSCFVIENVLKNETLSICFITFSGSVTCF